MLLFQSQEAKHARNLSELSDREEAWRSATLVPIHKQTADKREELCASDEKSLNPFDLEDENPSADRTLVCCWTTLSCTWLANGNVHVFFVCFFGGGGWPKYLPATSTSVPPPPPNGRRLFAGTAVSALAVRLIFLKVAVNGFLTFVCFF